MRGSHAALVIAADVNDWPYHDHDAGGSRFSPLKQITPANAGKLQLAWTFDTGVSGPSGRRRCVINGIMYVTAGKDIIALEPETAKVIWRYTAPAAVSRRGVAYWPGDRDTPPRLFTGSGDRLLAVDAERGKPSQGFGDGDTGSVDLKASIRGDVDGGFSLTSPPTIYKNIVITGGNNGEQSPSSGLYGDIRGWDAKTGKLLWSFHTVPRAGEPGVETWEGDSWKNRSGTNVWSFFTIDTERGIVYAPIGAPTSDYYGGDRHGANLYGNSVVALDAATGKLKWHQQLVHHDIWDYDVPAAPTLVDVKRNGKTTPAVAVMTKMSLVFIFDRVTGEPIFGMEERPVPQSGVPGEKTWPTQPFPLKPAPLARNTFDPEKDFYNLTPDHAAYCKELWKDNAMYTKGPYTPPDVEGDDADVPEHAGWRQLERVLVRSDARSGLHQRDEHRPGRQDGAGHGPRQHGADVGAAQPVGRRGRAILESRDEDSVLGRPVRRARRPPTSTRARSRGKVPLRVLPGAQGERVRQDRHAQHRRQHRDRRRRDLHRRDDRLAASARSSRRPASSCGRRRTGLRARHADDLPRQGRPLVRCRRRRAAAASSPRPRHGSNILAFALPREASVSRK